jgi:monoamine oxidase
MIQVDAVIVGAGAAGLSAARVLERSGLAIRVLEAKDRVGGRAFTDRESFAIPFDHGCTWLSAGPYNAFVKLAEENGLRMEECFYPYTKTQTFREGRWATQEESIERDEFVAHCELAIRDASKAGLDVALSDLIDTGSSWKPFFDSHLEAIQGCNSTGCSTLDYARNRADGEDLFLFDGYGSLIEKFGEGLPVELGAEVNRVDWSGEGVAIRSSKCEFSCRSAIITVSTGVLASNQIEFEPALPARRRAAIESLPMGRLAKVAIQFDQNIYGDFRDDAFIYFEKPAMSINMVTGMDDHRMAVAYLGGPLADAVEAMSDEEARDFILDRLEKIFGSTIREHVVGSLCTRWGSDPHIRGSYASALPGHADARAELASTLGDRIIFAGEATSQAHYGFAHGAYLEGKAAAERVIGLLNA